MKVRQVGHHCWGACAPASHALHFMPVQGMKGSTIRPHSHALNILHLMHMSAVLKGADVLSLPPIYDEGAVAGHTIEPPGLDVFDEGLRQAATSPRRWPFAMNSSCVNLL